MRIEKKIYGLLLLLLPLLAVSCLDDGGNRITLAAQPAVLKLASDGKKALLLKGGDMIHAENLETNPNLEVGDCLLADFVLDYSDAQNIKDSVVVDYYTGEISNLTQLAKNPLYPALSDTSKVVWTEKTITNIYEKSVLLEDNLFLFTDHSIRFDIKGLQFSYDKESGPEVEKDGSRIYNIYFRILGDSTSTQKEIKYNVLALDSLIHYQAPIEQAAGKDSLNFRINYLSAVKNDSTGAWKASRTYTILLPKK